MHWNHPRKVAGQNTNEAWLWRCGAPFRGHTVDPAARVKKTFVCPRRTTGRLPSIAKVRYCWIESTAAAVPAAPFRVERERRRGAAGRTHSFGGTHAPSDGVRRVNRDASLGTGHSRM